MKRILITTLVGVMAFSAVAFAGWKFGAEQSIDAVGGNFPLAAYVGYDFEAEWIDAGPFSIAGDIVVTREYDWSPGVTSIVALDGELAFTYQTMSKLILTSGGMLDYAQLPNYSALSNVYFGAKLIGYINDVLTLYCGATTTLRVEWDGSAWVTRVYPSFAFGFDAEW